MRFGFKLFLQEIGGEIRVLTSHLHPLRTPHPAHNTAYCIIRHRLSHTAAPVQADTA
jgi:hypothetical protein